jgi:cysteine desulfurase/selenocysteine lyase
MMNIKSFQYYRREFPVTKKYIYLDHAGISPFSLRVSAAVQNFLEESAKGGAFYYPKWSKQVDDVRKACSSLLNAAQDEIAFVKSTSHGLSIIASGLDWKSGDNVLVFEKEFPSNLYPWFNLEKKGVQVKFIPSREGRILLEDIDRLIDARTRLLAVSSVQFSNGFRLDLERAGELCKSRGILFCVDAIQSLGIIPMDIKVFNIDFLSADAHKWLMGPEGIGIFYCKREYIERITPPLIGWKSVQNEFDFAHPDFCLKTNALKFEEGSMNLMGIFGLGAALEILNDVGIERIQDRVLKLGEVIIGEADKRELTLLTPRAPQERGGNITVAGNFDPLIMRDFLREKGIMVNARGGGLRISPHFYNSEEEIAACFDTLTERLLQK